MLLIGTGVIRKKFPTAVTYSFSCVPAVDKTAGKTATKPVKLHFSDGQCMYETLFALQL